MTTSYFSLIEWPRPFLLFYEFVGIFLALGAVGFRYSSLRGRVGGPGSAIYNKMARRAAGLGLVGAVLLLAHIIEVLPRNASRAKLPIGEYLQTFNPNNIWLYATIVAIIAFALAAADKRWAWPVAAAAVVVGVFRNFGNGPIARMTTPVHIFTGGLWIGTLFVLVAAGLSVVMRGEEERENRGAVVADLVNAFSPLALVAGIVVVAFGVIAAFREIKPISGLWTTPYGYTLIVKVCVVAVVFALGAWNWKRQRPTLGSEEAAHSLRRSATLELIAATLVLMITMIMLSLPEPH